MSTKSCDATSVEIYTKIPNPVKWTIAKLEEFLIFYDEEKETRFSSHSENIEQASCSSSVNPSSPKTLLELPFKSPISCDATSVETYIKIPNPVKWIIAKLEEFLIFYDEEKETRFSSHSETIAQASCCSSVNPSSPKTLRGVTLQVDNKLRCNWCGKVYQ